MENSVKNISKNLTELRKKNNYTQLEIAEKFMYSDKTISKWENGDLLPDIETLTKLADFYGVTVDYFLKENKVTFVKNDKSYNETIIRNKIVITSLTISIVWFLAAVIFVYIAIYSKSYVWQIFVWCVPISCVGVIAFNKAYFHNHFIFFLTWSIFIWSLLLSVCLSLIDKYIWPLFIVGVPAQVIIFIWSKWKKIK